MKREGKKWCGPFICFKQIEISGWQTLALLNTVKTKPVAKIPMAAIVDR